MMSSVLYSLINLFGNKFLVGYEMTMQWLRIDQNCKVTKQTGYEMTSSPIKQPNGRKITIQLSAFYLQYVQVYTHRNITFKLKHYTKLNTYFLTVALVILSTFRSQFIQAAIAWSRDRVCKDL